jgi:hypothetical protein
MICLRNEIRSGKVCVTRIHEDEYLAAVARRAGDVDADIIAERKKPQVPPYFQAKPTWWNAANCRRPPVPVVAVCPDGTIEEYRSITEAAQAMAIDPQNLLHRLDRDALCRDRRWYRKEGMTHGIERTKTAEKT